MSTPSILAKKTKNQLIDDYMDLLSRLDGADATAKDAHSQQSLDLVENARQFTPESVARSVSELVLHSMIQYPEYDQAVIVTGDGDFMCLVEYFSQQGKLLGVLAPNHEYCSSLLRKAAGKKIAFISDIGQKLAYKRKGPHKDETL